jgi:glycosyltransferase involved in cell wall biosynthesis
LSGADKKPLLSLVIVAQNEERTLGQVLEAAKPIADEIIVVDSGSTDRTKEIARNCSAQVVDQSWLGYAAQKNFAIDLAKGSWILSLDADEVLTPDLVAEIKAVLERGDANGFVGYTIPRILYIGDTAVTHGGFYPDAQLRLFRAGAGRFNDRLVHEAVKVEGAVGKLQAAMRHYAYATVADFAAAMDKYARLSAQEYARRSNNHWRYHVVNELVHPIWTLFYRYIIRQGFLDGSLGWRLNCIYSDYVRRKIRYLRDLRSQS